jgi:predicted nucleic acid-binding protein
MPDAYIDTSALVKRYIEEPGTKAVDIIFDKASIGAITIATSVWNLGEAFGVFDYRKRRALLTRREFDLVVRTLTSEVVNLTQSGAMQLYPVRTWLLTEAWGTILTEQLYQADALQIVTCKDSKSKVLITSDEHLRKASERLGLKALDPHKQAQEIQTLFE